MTALSFTLYNVNHNFLEAIFSEEKKLSFLRNREPKNKLLLNLPHFLIGFTLIMKGVDKAEHYHHFPFQVLFIFFAGSFIILGTVFRHIIERKIKNFTALFHVAEGISLILIGVILLENSLRIPCILFFIGAVYLTIGIVDFFTSKEGKKIIMPRLLIILGTAFLAAALTALIFNLRGDGNIWMYITTVLLAAAGIGILLARRRLLSDSRPG